MGDKKTQIQQGESLPFSFNRGDETTDGFICTISVKQLPTDTAEFSRVIELTSGTDTDGNTIQVWEGFLTQTETAALSLGDWYLTAKLSNTSTDEEEQIPVRFFVSTPWA